MLVRWFGQLAGRLPVLCRSLWHCSSSEAQAQLIHAAPSFQRLATGLCACDSRSVRLVHS